MEDWVRGLSHPICWREFSVCQPPLILSFSSSLTICFTLISIAANEPSCLRIRASLSPQHGKEFSAPLNVDKHYVPSRRKFWSQTSDNMDRWKAEQGRGREKRKIRRKKSRRKKMQMRERVGKSRNTVFYQWFVAPEGRKVGSLKRRTRAEPAGQMRDEKLHAVVARSTFRSEKVQNTSASDHFWKLRCRKSVRRCGAKHISKSKCTKHLSSGPLLEVAMSKKCTPLWREAHFQVKMYKTHQVRTTFGSWDVEKVHAVVARNTFPSQNVQNTKCSRHFWRFGCWKSARRCGAKHISKSKWTKHTSVGPLLEVEMSKKCTPLWRQNVQNTRGSDHFWRFRCRFASRHYTTGHYTTLHSSTLHYTTLHSSTLH